MALLLVAPIFWTARADARAPLSHEVAVQLSLSYVPACTLCHSAGAQGGPADTPFATAMRERGLSASADSVAPALASVRRDGVDSDGDGTGDIDEIIAASDPNANGDGCECAAAGAAGAPSLFAPALMLLSLATRRRATQSRARARTRDARAN
jgi:MYXO-CTERM domain-containing protein